MLRENTPNAVAGDAADVRALAALGGQLVIDGSGIYVGLSGNQE